MFALGLTAPASAQSFSTLEERMTAAQFQAAGLNKLSAEELAELNAWLQQHHQATPTASTTTPGSTTAAPFTDTTEFSSRIVGEFRGWSGKTTFHLENGQVWQQSGHDKWDGVRLENPSIRIRPGFMGSWVLKVEGYNTTTRVRRIR